MPIDELREDDLPALQRLARACLEADGGLPAFADLPLLRARLLREETLAVRDDGELVAAAGLTRTRPGSSPAAWWPPGPGDRGWATTC